MFHSCSRSFIIDETICFKILLTLITTFFLLAGNARAQQGLRVEYYDGINFDRLAAVGYSANIDQYWNQQPPVPGVDPHYCSIRWTGKLTPTKSGTYRFSARVDDGIRVWVDDRLIIDQWGLNDVGIFQGTVDLLARRAYDLKVEYFNALIEGEVRLLWKIPVETNNWYDHWLADNNAFTVIAPEYFLRSDQPGQSDGGYTADTGIDDWRAPAKPEITPPVKKKKRNKTTVKPKKTQQPIASKAKVSAREAEQYIPKNIQFERAETIILESSFAELDRFAEFMVDHPHLTVRIEGHTDPVGDAGSNLLLSKRRAFKVARYLIDKGVGSERIKAEGYGGSRPLVVPEKGKYYPANRRVVFVMSGFK